MLPALLAQIGLPLLIRTVGTALERIDNPIAAGAAKALAEVDTAVQAGTITPDQIAEANRHVERMAEIAADTDKVTLTEVNQSLRTEVASDDAYVRRMRPTFGYVMALTWAALMAAVAWVIVSDPGRAPAVVASLASMDSMWTVGLGVLGIYVFKRSQEKTAAAGLPPSPGPLAGPLAGLIGRLTGK